MARVAVDSDGLHILLCDARRTRPERGRHVMHPERRWRASRIIFFSGFLSLFGLFCVGMGLAGFEMFVQTDWMLDHAFALAAVPVAVLVVGAFMTSKAKAVIYAMDLLCCPRCCCNLSCEPRLKDDPGGVRCPECGELWGVEAVKERWKQRFGLAVQPTEDG